MKKQLKFFLLLMITFAIPRLSFSGLLVPMEYVVEIHINLPSYEKKFELLSPAASKNFSDEDTFYIWLIAKPFLSEETETIKPNQVLFKNIETFIVKQAFITTYTYFTLLITALGQNLTTLYFNENAKILNFTIENLEPKDLKKALQKCSFLLENKDEYPALCVQLRAITKELKSKQKLQQEIILELTKAIANFQVKKSMPIKKHTNEERCFLERLLLCTIPCALPMDTTDDD